MNNFLKISLGSLTCGLFANKLVAQGAYLNFNAGYGFSMSSQTI
jgi:hypothetical protein